MNDMKKTNRFLEALNGFINAFELEQGKIGTKIKDKNGTEYVYCGSEYHNLENVDMEEMMEEKIRAMGCHIILMAVIKIRGNRFAIPIKYHLNKLRVMH